MPNPNRAKPHPSASLPSFLRGSSDRKEDAADQASEVGVQTTGQQLRSGQDTASLPTPSLSLVHRYENSWGKRVSISIDCASNAIHFENCYRHRWAFKFFPEEHFYCSISGVTSYFADHDSKHDRSWIILKTRTGTARVLFDGNDHCRITLFKMPNATARVPFEEANNSEEADDSDNPAFSNFYNALHHLLAFKERRFHAGSPWAMTLYLLAALFGFLLGQRLIMSNGAGVLLSSLGILLVVAPVLATYLLVDFLDRR